MSGAMDAAMRSWERGLLSVPDKNVCSAHIEDYAIKRFIRKSGNSGICDYCKKNRPVVELETLMEFLTDTLTHFYTDPANFMSYISSEGGYQGKVYDAWELLEELGLVVVHDELNDDIYNSLDLTNGWSEEYGNLKDYRYEHWIHFKNIVQHKSRFLFLSSEVFYLGGGKVSTVDFLEELGTEVRKRKMIRSLPSGTTLFRCRQHSTIEDVTKAEDICAPKEQYAIYPNRMSPSGISMFYAAFDVTTSIIETLDKSDKTKPFFTTAKFKTKQALNLIDLSDLPTVSAFDQKKWDLYYIVSFLVDFLHDFSKPIKRDGREHTEYVPTQVITEYFRFEFNKRSSKRIDGIIYPSSKDKRSTACVLFMDHYESLDKLVFLERSLSTVKI